MTSTFIVYLETLHRMPPQARLGDKAQVPADSHGCVSCPHTAGGPAVAGSPNVNVNGRPAIRVDDPGIHTACCGGNTWNAQTGSKSVFINGKPAHRLGDVVRHCGGTGKCIEGSGNVIVGDHSGDGTREQIEKIPQVGYEKQFRVISETTYTPIVNVLYEIRTPDGNMHTGTTDKNGLTKKVQSTQPGSAQITLHHKGQRSE